MSFTDAVELAGQIVEAAGVALIVLGIAVVMSMSAWHAVKGQSPHDVYRRARGGLGKVILLGLEILVAGDIIKTVAVTPNARNVLVLGGIVLIRTFLSWSIEMETEGRIPWRPRPSSP